MNLPVAIATQTVTAFAATCARLIGTPTTPPRVDTPRYAPLTDDVRFKFDIAASLRHSSGPQLVHARIDESGLSIEVEYEEDFAFASDEEMFDFARRVLPRLRAEDFDPS